MVLEIPSPRDGSTKQSSAAHDLWNVVALAGEPSQFTRATVFQDALALGTQCAFADDHQPHSISCSRIHLKRQHKRARQRALILDRVHPPHGADQPMLRTAKRAAIDRSSCA